MKPFTGAGLSLKPQYYDTALECDARGLWFEIHPENYMIEGGPRLAWLEAIRSRHPISLHGVSLSLAADANPERRQLDRLRALADRIEPHLVSEHLAWSTWRGTYLPDLLPFARTQAALERIASNIAQTQDALKRRIAIENPTHYLRIDRHEWDEIDFLSELVKRTGCGLLLDVNNVFLSAHNLRFDAACYIDRVPADAIVEIHLAGHSTDGDPDSGLLIDTHDAPVAPDVWSLYRRLIDRTGPIPTLIERDDNIPAFDALLTERAQAQRVLDHEEVAA
ncbi:DUF692 domain-containing protein [Trinickia sp. NRRL B-1857]|uniref:MNIO family bufferin maturase n=1 Tax=Trinickia sp. NRRL B-1857 TaxID=3162879 RepID=UPI003D2E8DF8